MDEKVAILEDKEVLTIDDELEIKQLKKLKLSLKDKMQNKIKKLKNINLKSIIKISKEFSINSNLLKNKRLIENIMNIERETGNASMIMLGNAVFSDKYFKGSKKLIIKDKGAHLL